MNHPDESNQVVLENILDKQYSSRQMYLDIFYLFNRLFYRPK